VERAPFLEIVDVRDEEPLEHKKAAVVASRPAVLSPSAGACLAVLAPLQQQPGSVKAYEEAHTFHMLPNGDVRVIQSPPRDIMLQADDERMQAKPQEGAVTEAHAAVGLPGEDSSTVVRFECPREHLQLLIGAHFHVGELAVDADLESAFRDDPGARSASSSDAGVRFVSNQDGLGICLLGVKHLILNYVNVLVKILRYEESSCELTAQPIGTAAR
jgi:hypothetical protein